MICYEFAPRIAWGINSYSNKSQGATTLKELSNKSSNDNTYFMCYNHYQRR